MDDDSDLLKDPGFWVAAAVALSPLLAGAALVIYVQS
jgi:hypothetical protein